MRKLSDSFVDSLKSGFLAGITQAVRDDHELDLEIRDNYINVYYKGNSLLKLTESAAGRYQAEIHEKFTEGLVIPSSFVVPETTRGFLDVIPLLKQNIRKYGKHSLEIEYEQMIVRANNYEPRNNSEYFVVDRQYTVSAGRFDLTGMFWDRRNRKKRQKVPMCLMEVKCALNQDIAEVHSQLLRYYEAVKPRAASIAEEGEGIFRQKLELELYDQPRERIEAMKTLTFSRDIAQFQFILILVDYNPNSSMFNPESLASLHFANQVKVFRGGFAMWQQNVLSPQECQYFPRG